MTDSDRERDKGRAFAARYGRWGKLGDILPGGTGVRNTALRTFTVAALTIDEQIEEAIEVDSIFDAPAAFVRQLVAANTNDADQVTILHNLRHGELYVTGDGRRWFLHQVRFERCDAQSYCYPPEELFLIVTADER